MALGLLVSDVVADQFGPDLRNSAPELVPVVLRSDRIEGDLSRVEVAFFSGDLYPERVVSFAKPIPRTPRLRWLQTFSTGVDHPYFRQLQERGVRVTTSSGANARAVAQLAVLFLLALARRLPEGFEAQRARLWHRRRVQDLDGATVVIDPACGGLYAGQPAPVRRDLPRESATLAQR